MKRIYAVLFSIISLSQIKAQYPNLTYANAISGTSVEIARSVAYDATGASYVTGYFQGTVDFDPSAATATMTSAGGDDIFLAKYNASGVYQWAYRFGNTTLDRGLSVATDLLGNVYITGHVQAAVDFDPGAGTANVGSVGTNDAFVAKYTGAGTLVWAFGIGSTGLDQGNSVNVDATGNVFVTGFFSGNADFDPSAGVSTQTIAGIQDIFVAKYDGNFVPANANFYKWAFNIGSSNFDNGNGVSTDAAGNVYVTGFFNGTADFDPSATTNTLANVGFDDVFLAKYNAAGVYQWAFNIGSTNPDVGYSVSNDAAGNSYLTGYFRGLADFDPTGATYTLTTVGTSEDIFVAKYDNGGKLVWAFNLGSNSTDIGNSIHVNSVGDIYLTGSFMGTFDFDPSSTKTTTLTAVGNEDIYVAKYTNNGTFGWAFNAGSSLTDISYGIKGDASGNVYVAGAYNGTLDIDPSATTSTMALSGITDAFVAKYACPVPLAPSDSTANKRICTGTAANLKVYAMNGWINWYSSMTSTAVIGTGSLMTTPTLTTGLGPTVYTWYADVTTCTVSAGRTAISVTVYPLPTLTVSGTHTTLCAGEAATLTANGASSYTFMPGSVVSNSAVISPTVNTLYTVTGKDSIGCINSATYNQVVDPCVGIVELGVKSSEFGVYPNPNNGEFSVKIKQVTGNTVLEIYNALGQLVNKVPVKENINKVNLAKEANGFYTVRVTENGKTVFNTKVLKN